MKIALFTEAYLPHINGVVTHVDVLAKGLRQLGHDVRVFCCEPRVKKDTLKDGVYRSPGVVSKKLYGFGLPSPYSPSRMRALKEFDPDIIHIHTEFGMGYFGVRAARKLQKPLVYTMHTMYDEYMWYVVPKYMIEVAQKVVQAFIWHIARHACAITGPSFKVQEYFKKLGVPTPVHVIHNCMELDHFKPENITPENTAAFREKYGIADDEMICCFVGRLGQEKSVDVLLDYFKEGLTEQDRVRLVIVGDGPSRPELEQQAARLGLLQSGKVIFTGKVEHVDMPPIYAACDVYVTASLSDTNSISMLEGMATGLPTLQRLDPLIAEQVVNGLNGYVFDSSAEMWQYIRKIRDMQPEERAALKESVLRSVDNRGSKALAENLLAVYNSVRGDFARKHWTYPGIKPIPVPKKKK